ncbi:hypothetical protein ACJ41O_000387 [Fusarium nematophilum]
MKTHLFRANIQTPCSIIQSMGNHVVTRLDHWCNLYPLLHQPRSVYESKHWRDLNYARERLRCFRFLVLLEKRRNKEITGPGSCLDLCLKAASQVASLYQQIQGTDKLVMNWTCVHDLLNAGFTVLYCGLVYGESDRVWNDSMELWTQVRHLVLDSIDSVLGTLTHISGRWNVVEKHLRVFKTLAGRVSDAIQTRNSLVEHMLGMQQGAEMGDPVLGTWESAIGFPDDVIDLENVDWSHVDWEAILGSASFQEA